MYEYVRIDMLRLIELNLVLDYLHQANDCEWRDDYQCFFILKGSKTHTWLGLNHGDIFERTN
jgi:hypothetical protein